ncbi:MAG: hypothetical protein KAS49_06095, partial [Candidatus Cloacimonetes bacterium]|nr:hypothetical protein [Candidatus Cloacimonadota bacterium]
MIFFIFSPENDAIFFIPITDLMLISQAQCNIGNDKMKSAEKCSLEPATNQLRFGFALAKRYLFRQKRSRESATNRDEVTNPL